jgi:type VI secretion system secreted protein Hcp
MAVDYYLKLDGIQGESVSDGHKDEIQLLSFSWGGHQVSSVGHTGGSGAGKVDLADLNIMKVVDKATTPLFKALVSGTHIKTGVLTAVKTGAGSGGKPFITISLKELFVTSLQISASSEIPTASVSFSYNEVKHEYSTQNEQGILTTTGSSTYNTKTNAVS